MVKKNKQMDKKNKQMDKKQNRYISIGSWINGYIDEKVAG